jgi:hypothetical protein
MMRAKEEGAQWDNRVGMVLCGVCLGRGRTDNMESQPPGTKGRVTPCEQRSRQGSEQSGRMSKAAAADIGVEMPRPSKVDERLGGPGRRIRWLIAGSAGVAERTVIAQISAAARRADIDVDMNVV